MAIVVTVMQLVAILNNQRTTIPVYTSIDLQVTTIIINNNNFEIYIADRKATTCI